MAVIINDGDYVQVRAWTVDGDQASVQRMWYFCNGHTGSAATDQEVADLLEALLAPLYKPIINNRATWPGLQVQVLKGSIWSAEVQSVVHAGAGTGGADALPRQTAGLIGWRTPLGGRQYRGRMYLPFPATAHDTGDGVPTAAYVTAATTLTSNWLTDNFFGSGGNSVQILPIIKHGPTKGTPPVPPVSPWTLITTGITNNKWATQRRRGAYGRVNNSPI